MAVCATLLAGLESGVLLAAVVVSVMVVAFAGVNVVVQLIIAPTAKLATGDADVHVVTAPAGAPVTTQLAFCATLGPLFTHTLVTDIGAPGVRCTNWGALATMSAGGCADGVAGVCTK